MTPDQHQDAARALLTAEETGTQIGLLSLKYPGMTLDDAYAIQAALVAEKAKTRKKTGWKIGLTSRAMQDALKIETPDSGVLFDDMRFENGATIPKTRFIQPRIEAEIAFVMKSDLDGKVSRAEVLAATEYASPALEILDTRILRADPETGQARLITDTISDNAANGGIVIGETRIKPDSDLRWMGAIVKRDGIVEETGLGAGVLDDPLTGVLWLIHRLADYEMGVKAGEVILSGSFIRPIEATPGSLINADFGPHGKVEITFG